MTPPGRESRPRGAASQTSTPIKIVTETTTGGANAAGDSGIDLGMLLRHGVGIASLDRDTAVAIALVDLMSEMACEGDEEIAGILLRTAEYGSSLLVDWYRGAADPSGGRA